LDTERRLTPQIRARGSGSIGAESSEHNHDFGEDDGAHFIASEFIERETLRQHLVHSRMAVQEVLNVATQVASALSVAHQVGMIHHDI
jgi:serine/threonine protein kinase